MDARTGKRVPIEATERQDIEDPFIVLSMGASSSTQPGEVQVTWNVDVPLTITAAGYESQIVRLTRDLPKRVGLRLIPTAIKAASLRQ